METPYAALAGAGPDAAPDTRSGPANVRVAWFTLAISIYRGYEAALESAQTDRRRVGAVRRLKAARPAIQHMLRDVDLEDEDRNYLVALLTRIERYFIHVPADQKAA